MRYLVIACILMFILSILSCNNINHKKTTKLLEPPVVDLYSADWCYWCDQSEKFLKDNKIKYAKYDIMYTVKRFKFENDITGKVQNKIYYKNFNILKIKDKK